MLLPGSSQVGFGWPGLAAGMGMVAADDRLAIGAGRFQRREMIFGMNFKSVVSDGEIARRMQRQRQRLLAVAPALDQAATFVRKGVARMLLDLHSEFVRQRQFHFSEAA